MALDGRHALTLLDAIGNANSQKEYYLTDMQFRRREDLGR
jgi:bifunctional UDP-N-acetylglucosamine pyrophosphorylase/glucosamine-1-phosphate N-acetyltransferase